MDRRSDLRECASCTCFAVRRAARTITQHYDRLLRPSGLRATQFTLLAVLSLEGPLPLSRAADRLGLERTTLTRNLRPLKARGLVDEEASGDRRVRMIAITRRGLAAARAALPRWRAAQRSVAGRLDRAALRALDLAARAAIPTRPSRPRSSSGSKEG